MTKRSDTFSIRTLLPVGLGVAVGLAIGAAALANVPASRTGEPAQTQVQQQQAVKPLSSAKGISFARVKKDGERCFATQGAEKVETICTH